MIDPQLTRYGQLAAALDSSSPAVFNPAAKIHFVGNTTVSWYGELLSILGPDADGGNRLFSTLPIALADSNVVASRGDIIFLLPGYTQTITGAAGVSITKAGIQIIGLGMGSLRPTFTFTTAVAASFDVSAANINLKNLVFTNGIDAQTAMINVTTADVTFDTCEFNTNTGTTGTILGILTGATATRLRVIASRFLGPAVNTGTTTTAQIKHEVGVDYEISGNYFTGKMTQSILNVTTVLRGLIYNNRFVVATGTSAITMAAASTPFITVNRINVPSGTTPITAAAGFVSGNSYSAAAGVTAGAASTF